MTMIGIIYKAENVLNGEVYIGATTNSLKARKSDHLERVKREENNKFHVAMSVYGTLVFSWKQIDTADTINELADKEKQYITEYNSKEEGYNSDSGGGFKKTVYQYNISTGELIQKYDSLTEASKSINAKKQDISRACLSVNKQLNGYYWSYKNKFAPKKDYRKRKVAKVSKKGNIIENYNSISEASKKANVNKSSIAKVCRGERKTAGGYRWICV